MILLVRRAIESFSAFFSPSSSNRDRSTHRLECESLEQRELLTAGFAPPLAEAAHEPEHHHSGHIAEEPHHEAYVASGYKWNQARLGDTVAITFSFHSSFHRDIRTPGATDAIREALALWSTYAPLEFVEVPDSGPDPTHGTSYVAGNHPMIRFGTSAYDGPFNILATAFQPSNEFGQGGDVIFDRDETWTTHPLSLIHI